MHGCPDTVLTRTGDEYLSVRLGRVPGERFSAVIIDFQFMAISRLPYCNSFRYPRPSWPSDFISAFYRGVGHILSVHIEGPTGFISIPVDDPRRRSTGSGQTAE